MITLTKTLGKLGYKYVCPLCSRENVKVWEKSNGAWVLDETFCDGCGVHYSITLTPVDESLKKMLKDLRRGE